MYGSNYETSPVCYFGCKQPIGLHHATICDKFVLPHGKVCSYLRLFRFLNQSTNQSINQLINSFRRRLCCMMFSNVISIVRFAILLATVIANWQIAFTL